MILKSRYCVIEKIGHGGGGSLYLAKDLELGNIWAVKQIPLSQKREAKLLRLLEHHSLPCMVDYLEKEDFCYLVMEYIRGKSLGDFLREGRIFTYEEIMEIGKSTAQVLYYLHTRKPAVFYGDLKPDNLMLTENGKLYLVDFGSAVLGYCQEQKLCYGTKGYAAPEQYEGMMDVTSDIYALGKTLAELCGKQKWTYFLKYPGFFFFLFKCCREQKEIRWQDMEQVQNALKNIRSVFSYFRVPGIMGMTFLLGISLLILWAFATTEKKPFQEACAEVTGLYYQKDFQDGEKRKGILESAEKKLQRMLRQYTQDREQRWILQGLALNSELQQDFEHTKVYYEQLLIYQEDCEDAYVDYGMFLCRQHDYQKSREIWQAYVGQKNAKTVREDGNYNLKIWEQEMKQWEAAHKEETEAEEKG